MKREVKVVVLVVSHVVVFGVGVAWFAGYRAQAMFQAAAQEPLHRVGLAMMSVPDKDHPGYADFDELSRTRRAPTAEVIRLAALLESVRFREAAETCTALAWSHCDAETLGEMRKALQ